MHAFFKYACMSTYVCIYVPIYIHIYIHIHVYIYVYLHRYGLCGRSLLYTWSFRDFDARGMQTWHMLLARSWLPLKSSA